MKVNTKHFPKQDSMVIYCPICGAENKVSSYKRYYRKETIPTHLPVSDTRDYEAISANMFCLSCKHYISIEGDNKFYD